MEIDGTRWLRVVLHALFMAAAASLGFGLVYAGMEARPVGEGLAFGLRLFPMAFLVGFPFSVFRLGGRKGKP